VFGFVGAARLPQPLSDIFVCNTNVGEYHIFSGTGFYVSRLFQPDPLKVEFPDKAVPGAVLDNAPPGMGGEDFGGSLAQSTDGRIYIQAGKTALWNVEVVGLDSVRSLPGSGGRIMIGGADVARAAKLREQLMQEAVGLQRLTVKKTTPSFTGNVNGDFRGVQILRFQKQADAEIRAAATWDDRFLYLGWHVRDNTPWVNGATDAALMYIGGDTVDFQLGLDPKANKDRGDPMAGDLRLSIGNFQGTPTAVLYRKVSAVKKPRSFSSGVVKSYVMDYVDVVQDAKIEVKIHGSSAYVVEAAMPLAALGLQPRDGLALRGDLGATHGDPAGQRTRLRTYWSNQHTGIVDDVVFELKMEPKNWGEIRFAE
jgi:hypothetical protein